MRVIFWLISVVVVASEDASPRLEDYEDTEATFGEAVQGLVFGEAAKAAAYASVMQVASKFEIILTSIEDLVKKDQELVHKVSKFANAFRPVQLAAHSLIVNMESTSKSLSGDLLPSLKDIWHDGDYQAVTPAIKEILEAFEEPLEEFDEVKAKYADLAIKAEELSSEARVHSLIVDSSKKKHLFGGGASLAVVVVGAGAVASSITMTPLAVAYLYAAGFGVASGTGGIVISYSSHQFADEIMRSAQLLSDVMHEINKLMYIQTKNLIIIRQKHKDGLKHTEKIDKHAQSIGSGSPNVKRTTEKVNRLLAMLTETSLALGEKCREYQEADIAGQQAVWEKLEKQANRANTLED